MQDASQSGSLPFSVGKVIGGKYRVERRIGAGAAGIVVAAEHMELHEQVALKILNPDLKSNKEALARFSREARAMFTLKSEHVGRVFDVGKLDTGEPYIVMELLAGQTLAEFIKDTRPPLADAWLLIRQIAEAVGEAHAADIIHRDLKPENIFVTKKGDALSAKVIDFGVSRARFAQEEGSITHAETLLGTPRYMAPEQFGSSRAGSPRSDVWSLGVIFYRMLAGVFPYTPRDVKDLVTQLRTVRPKPLHDVQPEVSVVMSAIVMRCLSVRPEDRYADARELAQVIAAVPVPGMPAVAPAAAKAEPTLDATPTTVIPTPPPPPPEVPVAAVAPVPAPLPPPSVPPRRAPEPSYSDYETMKRPLPEPEEVEAEPDPDAETQALLDDPNNPAYDDDVSTLVPTRVVRTAVMRTPGGVPVRPRTVRLPTPPDAVRASVPPPAGPTPAPLPGGRRRGVAWSEIEVAVVVGAFITMLAIMIYVIAQRKSATPTTPGTTSTSSTSTASPTTRQRR